MSRRRTDVHGTWKGRPREEINVHLKGDRNLVKSPDCRLPQTGCRHSTFSRDVTFVSDPLLFWVGWSSAAGVLCRVRINRRRARDSCPTGCPEMSIRLLEIPGLLVFGAFNRIGTPYGPSSFTFNKDLPERELEPNLFQLGLG